MRRLASGQSRFGGATRTVLENNDLGTVCGDDPRWLDMGNAQNGLTLTRMIERRRRSQTKPESARRRSTAIFQQPVRIVQNVAEKQSPTADERRSVTGTSPTIPPFSRSLIDSSTAFCPETNFLPSLLRSNTMHHVSTLADHHQRLSYKFLMSYPSPECGTDFESAKMMNALTSRMFCVPHLGGTLASTNFHR